MKYQEVAAKLHKLGCLEDARRTGGSHRKWRNPTNGHAAPVPEHFTGDYTPTWFDLGGVQKRLKKCRSQERVAAVLGALVYLARQSVANLEGN